MIRELASLVISMVLVALVVFAWMNFSHSQRLKRVRREYQDLDQKTLNDILTWIDQAGMKSPACTVLVAAELDAPTSANSNVAGSRFGGIPYAEANDVWPAAASDRSEAADFLIQVALDKSFPQPWPGRLIVVFASHETDQIVRSYSSPAADVFVGIGGGPRPQHQWKLDPVRIPRQTIDENRGEEEHEVQASLLDYDPVVLLDSVDGLQEKLNSLTSRPADLLAAILAPSHCGYGFELSDIVQLGGQPVWLQDEVDGIMCSHCGRSMRFLFQFGDLNGGDLLGPSGVCYVFGCDEHPQDLRAIAQNSSDSLEASDT